MLLYLKKDEELYYLLQNTNTTVGRINCNINLSKDQSISRLHANILNDNGRIYVTDIGSSNGTYVYRGNVNHKLELNVKFELTAGDQIKFGLQKNIWKLIGKYFETTYTKLSRNEKAVLVSYASQIGLNIRSEWTDTCTYLTASQIFLTVKILCSLIEGSEIVHIDYWKDCLDSIKKNEPLPNSKNYLPPFDKNLSSENSLLFKYNSNRKTLFRGKIFIFGSENECKQKRKLIELAGGKVELLKNVNKKELINSDNILLQSSLNEKNNQIQEVLSHHGLRVVPDHEIIIAILCCDISKNCNPLYNIEENSSNTEFHESLREKFISSTQLSTQNNLLSQNILSLDTNEEKNIRNDSSNNYSARSINSQCNQLVKDNNCNLHITAKQECIENKLASINQIFSEKKQSEVIEEQLSEKKYITSPKCNKRQIPDDFLIDSKSKKKCLEESSQFAFNVEKDVSDDLFSSCEESDMDNEYLHKNKNKHDVVSEEFALSKPRNFAENFKEISITVNHNDNKNNEHLHPKNSNKRNCISDEFMPEPKRFAEESELKSVNMTLSKTSNKSLNLTGWLSKSINNLNISSVSKNISTESLHFCNEMKNAIIIKSKIKTFVPTRCEPVQVVCENTGNVIKNYKKFKKVHITYYKGICRDPSRKVELNLYGNGYD